MSTLTISPKFQVVIPKEARETLRLRPGDKLELFVYDGRIQLIPVRPMEEMRGFAPGIDTTVARERDPHV